MGDLRSFVALELPHEVRDALAVAVAPVRSELVSLRWVPPANWHVTLAFLGRIGLADRVRAQIALQTAARSAVPCALELDGRVGRFGDHVLWATVSSDGGGLDTLAVAIRGALDDAGMAVDDRPLRAHLTLARARRGARIPREVTLPVGAGLPMRWTARRVALLGSVPSGGAVRYRRIASWPLTGTDVAVWPGA